MRVYVAGRTNNLDEVRAVQDVVRASAGVITHDWTQVVEEVGNYRDEGTEPPHPGFLRICANQDRDGVLNADLVVVVCSRGLNGTLIEMGMALAWKKPVWVINEPERESVFFYMDDVERVRFKELRPRLLDFAENHVTFSVSSSMNLDPLTP